jgi:hypothetical protein
MKLATSESHARARIRAFFYPLTIILICIPLVFELIPRNPWYGVRDAFASDVNWYAINRLGGVGVIAACVVWLWAAVYAPPRYVKAIGVTAILLALAILTITQGWTL